MDKIDCDLVICPDASSNDYKEHRELYDKGIECICLDHHPVDNPDLISSDPAIIINVQLTEYPNKALTGGGVTYKFVSAFEDIVRHGNQPTEFMDLCAIANCGDMADYRESEIRAIIKIGFSNIKNPMLHEMVKQHSYVIEKRNGLNYLSAAFGIVPFTNAICRSATMEEKELFFKGMLTRYAFDKVPSSKRGITGDVYLYQEAVTIADRVKRRQDKLVQETMEVLDKRIQDNHLTDNAIIVCLCEPDEIEAEICGLVANKIQAQYQHPALVLRRYWNSDLNEYVYQGSARNYSYCLIENMKDMCEKTKHVIFCAGHQSAFGFGIRESEIADFIKATNELYKGVNFTPVYWVDFIWKPSDLDAATILEIAELDIWGQEMPQSQVVVKDIPLSESNVQILGLAKGHPTIKIECNGVEFMLFKVSEELYEQFIQPNQYLTIVGTCSKNEWNGIVKPQILIDDYDLQEKWIF
jgi:single-stranded-DNA-specific exonuclease